MMANAPFGNGSSLLEELKGPDNGMQQINSGFSSLSFTPTMSRGVIQKPDVPIPMSPMASNNTDGSFRSFIPQEEPSPYYPSSPMSPIFRQQNNEPQMSQAQSLGDGTLQGIASRNNNNNFAASPVIHSKSTFTPSFNTPASLDGRSSSQFLSGNNNQHHDPLASFLPPPPNLDASDSAHQIGRSDNNSGLFMSEAENNQPTSPFISTPRDSHGNILFQDGNLNRERALSSPGIHLRQPSFGAKSPPASSGQIPSGQILYDDKPSPWNGGGSSWKEGSGFPAPRMHSREQQYAASSPSNYDRFNSRPPRHCGSKDAQALLSPRIEMRHAASEGNFNFPAPMPIGSHFMNPVANNPGRPQSNMPSAAIGSPSFDSSFQGGQLNSDRHSFPSNSNPNYLQYQIPQSSPMPPGLANSGQVQQDNYFVQQSPLQPGIQPGLQRHNSAGSQHFLVNERGEIVGHASPVITHNTLGAGFAQGEPRNNFPPTRPQRANSYGGPHPVQLNQIQGHQGPPPPPQTFTSTPFQNGFQNGIVNNINNPSPMDNHVGSIGDGRVQHHRHNTEPIPPTLFNQNPVGNILSMHPVSALSDGLEQGLAGENIEGIEGPNEDNRVSSGVVLVEENASSPSYASKLMMPRPKPIDLATGRVSSAPLTAGASLAKSGPRMVYNVKFKRSQRNFVLGQRVTREINIGCYVKVEADRGEDLGIIMSIIPMEKFLASNRHRSMTEDSIASGGDQPPPAQASNIGDLRRIMRVATHDEISLLEVKRGEEEMLLKICRTKVRQRGLPMTVVDAEYQFDRNKLTFFFQAEGRIDFRELVRDLFSIYKTRIWMQQLDKNGAADEAEGDLADE